MADPQSLQFPNEMVNQFSIPDCNTFTFLAARLSGRPPTAQTCRLEMTKPIRTPSTIFTAVSSMSLKAEHLRHLAIGHDSLS
jgi:hypothetical protein